MATIRYKGHKERMPVTFPIGEKRMTAQTTVKFADPYLEMSDEDAEKLIALDSHNFEIIPPLFHQRTESSDDTPTITEKRKGGRPKKVTNG